MKKFIHILATTFLLIFSLMWLAPTASAQAESCGMGKRGYCGAQGGCNDPKAVCVFEVLGGYKCLDGSSAGNGRCENIDHASNNVVCGITGYSDTWCASSGGCAQGYMCDSDTKTCKKDVGCDNVQNGYNVQCGKKSGSIGQCGSAGVCAEGYRCTSNFASGSGYSCLPIQDINGNYCPNSPVQPAPTELLCGQLSTNAQDTCKCTATNPDGKTKPIVSKGYCCGYAYGDNCWESRDAYEAANPTPTPQAPNTPPPPQNTPVPGTGGNPNAGQGGGLDIFAGPNSEDFKMLNPLGMSDPAIADQYFNSPAGIISRVLLFAFPIAGLILFVMLIWAGFQILSGAFNGGSKAIDAGRQRATTALLGFLLLFVAYWVMQIIELIFSITIL